MNKDAAIIKALTELGLRPEQELTADEEKILSAALDPYEGFLNDIEKLFRDPNDKVD